jgi:glucan phosphoethanolaminetransferase (alkaline phosphatase superfamily)
MFASVQEKIVAAVSLFSLGVGVIFFSMRKEVFNSIYLVFASLISIFLTLYNLRCVLYGGCSVWSWILTLFISITAIMTIFMYGQLIELQLRGDLAQDESKPFTRVILQNA